MNTIGERFLNLINVKPKESRLFRLIALGKFFVLFNYTVLRDMKDAFVTCKLGAEVVPFLKGWLVLATSSIGFYIYGLLASKVSQKSIFTVYTLFFAGYFALFGFVLYPNLQNVVLSDESILAITEVITNNIGAWAVPAKLLMLLKYWPLACFYILSELWGAFFVFFFWHLANSVTEPNQAKRLYPKFAILSNCSLIFAGITLRLLLKLYPGGAGSISDSAIYVICSLLTIASIAMWYCYSLGLSIPKIKKEEGGKLKLSFSEGLKIVSQNQNILLVAILVLSYSACVGMLDTTFKKQLEMFTNKNSEGYLEFTANMSIFSGFFVILLVSITQNAVKSFGWKNCAMATPIMLISMGGIFLSLATAIYYFEFEKDHPVIAGYLNIGQLLVIAGAMQNVLTKGFKYVLFDPTKEIAFINMDKESKSRGKAAIDIIGGRIGKAAGTNSIILMLGTFFRDINSCIPVILFLISCLSILWIRSVMILSKSELITSIESTVTKVQPQSENSSK